MDPRDSPETVEDGTECSETSAYEIQTPGNYSEETYNIQNTAKVWNQEEKKKNLTLLEKEMWGVQVSALLLHLVIPELQLIHLGCICYLHNKSAAPCI